MWIQEITFNTLLDLSATGIEPPFVSQITRFSAFHSLMTHTRKHNLLQSCGTCPGDASYFFILTEDSCIWPADTIVEIVKTATSKSPLSPISSINTHLIIIYSNCSRLQLLFVLLFIRLIESKQKCMLFIDSKLIQKY